MIRVSGFPRLKENGMVQEAIQQLRSFCSISSSGLCGFNELMVVVENGKLIGVVNLSKIFEALGDMLISMNSK
jgi:Mg/Co/Ni transporter MgtE